MLAEVVGAFCQLLAENLKCFDMPQTIGTLENMDLKLVSRNGIKRPIQVFFCEFVQVKLLTLHSAPR